MSSFSCLEIALALFLIRNIIGVIDCRLGYIKSFATSRASARKNVGDVA